MLLQIRAELMLILYLEVFKSCNETIANALSTPLVVE